MIRGYGSLFRDRRYLGYVLTVDEPLPVPGKFEYNVMATVEILNNPGNPYHSTTTLKWGNVDVDSDLDALVV